MDKVRKETHVRIEGNIGVEDLPDVIARLIESMAKKTAKELFDVDDEKMAKLFELPCLMTIIDAFAEYRELDRAELYARIYDVSKTIEV